MPADAIDGRRVGRGRNIEPVPPEPGTIAPVAHVALPGVVRLPSSAATVTTDPLAGAESSPVIRPTGLGVPGIHLVWADGGCTVVIANTFVRRCCYVWEESDGTLIHTDRTATPGSTPGVDLWWSGKH